MDSQIIFCSLCKLKEPSDIYLCPDCGISLCESCLGNISSPTCVCGSSRLRKMSELSAYALQGVFDLQRLLEKSVFSPLKQYNIWMQHKNQMKAYSLIFETEITELDRSLTFIIANMRFVLSNLKDYSTKLRKLFVDITTSSGFSVDQFKKFQEDLEYTNQDITFFLARIEDKSSRITPLLEEISMFEMKLHSYQEILGNAHNEIFVDRSERVRWISDIGQCEIHGKLLRAYILTTNYRILVFSRNESYILTEFKPEDIEDIKVSRSLMGRRKCRIRASDCTIQFSKTRTDYKILKKQLLNRIPVKVDIEPSQEFFDPAYFTERYHERIRLLLKLTPGDTGRWKAVLIEALNKVSNFVNSRTHDLSVVKRTYQRTLHELLKVENSNHFAVYENRLQEIDEELAELGFLNDILNDAFSQMDTEIDSVEESETESWIQQRDGLPTNQSNTNLN